VQVLLTDGLDPDLTGQLAIELGLVHQTLPTPHGPPWYD
jgi:hypothetical protein